MTTTDHSTAPGSPSSTSATARRRSPTTPRWTAELAAWSEDLPRPELDPRRVGALGARPDRGLGDHAATCPCYYDFWGFPQRYYEVTYDAPGAPELARSVAGLLSGAGETPAPGPDPRARPRRLRAAEGDVPRGRRAGGAAVDADPRPPAAVRPRRAARAAARRERADRRVRASRRTTSAWFDPSAGPDAAPPTPSAEFDHWAAETVGDGDVDAVLDFLAKAPAAREAHPRTEHWAPLYVALGAASASGGLCDAPRASSTGFWFGLSKRSWQFA